VINSQKLLASVMYPVEMHTL